MRKRSTKTDKELNHQFIISAPLMKQIVTANEKEDPQV
jgi:hypothetical protein